MTLLAEDGDKAVGFLIGLIQKPAPGAARSTVMAQLNNIFVREESRGQKIGEQLADEFKRLCRAEQVEQLNVTVNSQNESAIAFYNRIGFAPSRMLMSRKI